MSADSFSSLNKKVVFQCTDRASIAASDVRSCFTSGLSIGQSSAMMDRRPISNRSRTPGTK